jgi:hypothetical protein
LQAPRYTQSIGTTRTVRRPLNLRKSATNLRLSAEPRLAQAPPQPLNSTLIVGHSRTGLTTNKTINIKPRWHTVLRPRRKGISYAIIHPKRYIVQSLPPDSHALDRDSFNTKYEKVWKKKGNNSLERHQQEATIQHNTAKNLKKRGDCHKKYSS